MKRFVAGLCDTNITCRSITKIDCRDAIRATRATGSESPKRLTVVTSEESFQEEWFRLSTEQAPSIDFGSVSVVIAEMGTQTSTGVAQITIQSAVTSTEFTEIVITSFVPGESCALDAALSTPFHIVAVESKNQILFIEQQDTVVCN